MSTGESESEEELLEGVPRPGDVVAGKYTVEAVLGSGAMGVVLKARHLQLQQNVAMKVLRKDAAKRPDVVARFLREARAAIAIQSAHVVRVMDVGTLESGAPFMVMELLMGSDLMHVIQKRGALPLNEAVNYVLQCCDALGEAHALGIVHRDLKPANVFVTQRADGSPLIKLVDFGISKGPYAEADLQLSLTETAAILGSPMYMSPEQVRSAKNVDQRADIWALGVILYKLVTNAPPFEGETFSSLCAAIVADAPTPIPNDASVPEDLAAIIWRCLEKKPADRYQTVADLAEALTPFAPTRLSRLSVVTNNPSSRRDAETITDKSASKSTPIVSIARPASNLEQSAAGAWGTDSSERRRQSRMAIVIGAVSALAIGLAAIIIVPRITDRHDEGTKAAPAATTPTTPAASAAPTPTIGKTSVIVPPTTSVAPTTTATPSAVTAVPKPVKIPPTIASTKPATSAAPSVSASVVAPKPSSSIQTDPH